MLQRPPIPTRPKRPDKGKKPDRVDRLGRDNQPAFDTKAGLKYAGGILGLGFVIWGASQTGIPDIVGDPCARDPRESFTMVVEVSDPITENQAEEAQAEAFNMLSTAKAGARINVVTLGDADGSAVKWLLKSACYPGGDINMLAQSQGEYDDAWSEFEKGLVEAFNKAMTPTSKALTPLYESITSIANSRYIDATDTSNVLIISDMLQNTSGASIYHDDRFPWSDEGRKYLDNYETDLSHVTLNIAEIQQPKYSHRQTDQLWEFHKKYFGAQGLDITDDDRVKVWQ